MCACVRVCVRACVRVCGCACCVCTGVCVIVHVCVRSCVCEAVLILYAILIRPGHILYNNCLLCYTSRVPVVGGSSVCMICMKYRRIILIIIIIIPGQILLSYIANTSRTHAHRGGVQVFAVRWFGSAQP